MKSTDSFKQIIESKLREMGETDSLFAKNLQKTNKNIDECITYILNTVKDSGCMGFSDDEIYGMAAHYYDEDDIVPGEKISMNVVVNHKIELTAEEILQAKSKAKEQVVLEEKNRITHKPKPVIEQNKFEQISLF